VKSILDPSFRYTPSYETDVKKTFERLRREQQQRWQAQARAESARLQVVALPRGAFSTERG
jgi:hypothetical protein